MYKLVKSLSCTPDTNVTLCVNYSTIKYTHTHTYIHTHSLCPARSAGEASLRRWGYPGKNTSGRGISKDAEEATDQGNVRCTEAECLNQSR